MAQQSPPPQQGGGGGDNSNDAMWIAAFFAGVLVVLWMTRAYYFPFIFKIKYYELLAVNYIYPVDISVFDQIVYAYQNPQALKWQTLFSTLNNVGSYYRYPVAIILFIFGLFIYLRNPTSKFSATFNIKNFREFQKTNWPQIIPASKLDLVKEDIKKGPWASAYTPIFFSQKHKLLDVIVNPNPNPLLGELPKVAKLKEANARQVFAEQLGYIWQGPEKLPIHRKALFAIFAAMANKDRDAGFKFIRQFNTSLEYNNSPDFTGIDELLEQHKNSKLVKKVESRHAYVMTIMAAMLELARTDGVVATADFLWLKTVDRPLWYMLSNVGRRAAFPEVAGAVAHWRIESRMQRKLITPMVEEAVKALKMALNEIIYPEDDED